MTLHNDKLGDDELVVSELSAEERVLLQQHLKGYYGIPE
jgi:hypothetical protein